MAVDSDYDPGHIEDVGSELWRSLLALTAKLSSAVAMKRSLDSGMLRQENVCILGKQTPTVFEQLPSVQNINMLPLVVMNRQSNCGTFIHEVVTGYSKDITARYSVFCSPPMVAA